MKGKYITTSLLIAIMASERTARSINVPETKAITDDHTLLWSKEIPSGRQLAARMQGRDELKFS